MGVWPPSSSPSPSLPAPPQHFVPSPLPPREIPAQDGAPQRFVKRADLLIC